jgi:hypothetical protein
MMITTTTTMIDRRTRTAVVMVVVAAVVSAAVALEAGINTATMIIVVVIIINTILTRHHAITGTVILLDRRRHIVVVLEEEDGSVMVTVEDRSNFIQADDSREVHILPRLYTITDAEDLRRLRIFVNMAGLGLHHIHITGGGNATLAVVVDHLIVEEALLLLREQHPVTFLLLHLLITGTRGPSHLQVVQATWEEVVAAIAAVAVVCHPVVGAAVGVHPHGDGAVIDAIGLVAVAAPALSAVLLLVHREAVSVTTADGRTARVRAHVHEVRIAVMTTTITDLVIARTERPKKRRQRTLTTFKMMTPTKVGRRLLRGQ